MQLAHDLWTHSCGVDHRGETMVLPQRQCGTLAYTINQVCLHPSVFRGRPGLRLLIGELIGELALRGAARLTPAVRIPRDSVPASATPCTDSWAMQMTSGFFLDTFLTTLRISLLMVRSMYTMVELRRTFRRAVSAAICISISSLPSSIHMPRVVMRTTPSRPSSPSSSPPPSGRSAVMALRTISTEAITMPSVARAIRSSMNISSLFPVPLLPSLYKR
mmetsp:Transcript_20480/g.39195  ORF Transcript_20480/g.39195 Transcript_20480/m.39195 type:complete len:219 (+) Transcript_20480:250-906(+)